MFIVDTKIQQKPLPGKQAKQSTQHEHVLSSSSDDIQKAKPRGNHVIFAETKAGAMQNEKTYDNIETNSRTIVKSSKIKDKTHEKVLSDGDTSEDEDEVTKGQKSNESKKESQQTRKDLTLGASDIGSIFISKLSASQAKPFTVPSTGLSKAESAAQQQQRRQSSDSEESEGKGISHIPINYA